MSIRSIWPWLILFSCLCDGAFGVGRNIRFEHLSTNDGMSHASVMDILQDHHGFMWFATQEGLNRFDGYDFVIYEHDYRDATSLADDWVWSLCLDDDNNIWIGTNNGGLNYFDQNTKSFLNWRHDASDQRSLSSNDVRVVFLDSKKRLWVGTSAGLNRKVIGENHFERYLAADDGVSLPHESVTAIFEDSMGQIWVGTEVGLARFDAATNSFFSYQHDPVDSSSLSDSHIRVIKEYEGELWIGTQSGGVNRYSPRANKFHHYRADAQSSGSLQSGLIRDIQIDHENTIWIGTDKGLSEWQPAEDNFVTYLHEPEDVKSLSGNRVDSIFQDASNVLWVGSYEGVDRWNYLSGAFAYYTQADGQLNSDVVVSLAQSDNGSLWVGTYGAGLNRLDMNAAGGYEASDFLLPLADQRVMALWAEGDKNLWIGTRTAGLCQFGVLSGDLSCMVHEEGNQNSLSANGITAIYGEEDVIWVGTYGGGLNRIDRITQKITHYRHAAEDIHSLGSDRVLAIYRDSFGILWVGAEGGGLNLLDEVNHKFDRFQANENDPDAVSNDTAWEIFESSDGTLWIGTLNGGVNFWHIDDRYRGEIKFQHLDRINGLQSNTIYGILEDDQGAIWMSGNRGLVQIDPSTMQLQIYDQHNGTRGDEFNFGARLKDKNGRLLFGGAKGLLAVKPSDIHPNLIVPPVFINGNSSLNESVFAHSTQGSPSNITLGYDERMITFNFAALDYASPDKNQYEYQLVGFDENWIQAQGFRRATYTNIPAGDYTFRVKASNSDKVWNLDGAAINLSVVPAPWLSWWAYLIYISIVSGSGASFVYLQRRKLSVARQQHQILEDLVRLRTHELAEQNDKLEGVNDQLLKASMTDALTGLHNRRYLYDYLENQVAIMQRYLGELEEGESAHEALLQEPSIFFMMIDLDGFKNINDSFGHPAGDEALIQVCDVLVKHTRDSDTLIRWGGDEFLIVGRCHGLHGPNQLAERIRCGLMEHTFLVGNGSKGYMTGSIGFAPYPFNSWHPERFNWEQVLAIADQAAYVAKSNGRNAWLGIEGAEMFGCAEYNQIGDSLQQLFDQECIKTMTSMVHTVNYSA